MKILFIILCSLLLIHCSQFALVTSGASIAISQNTYARLYNATDIITVIYTKKSIKGHMYDTIIKERKK